MENKVSFSIGAILAIGIAFTAYRIYKIIKDRNIIKKQITYIDIIDYEYLFDWLKKEYGKANTEIKNGAKFGIMPSAIAKKTFSEEFSTDIQLTNSQDVICAFIIDENEENVITNQYFVYSEMGQSLKDILHSDKVYIQELKK